MNGIGLQKRGLFGGTVRAVMPVAGNNRMLPCFEEVQQKAENVLRAAESPLASTMFDAWHETALFCGVLDHVRDRCKKVQSRMKATILK